MKAILSTICSRFSAQPYATAHGIAARTRTGIDGCTSFAIMPECTKTHETFIGQNWDWMARLLRQHQPLDIDGIKALISDHFSYPHSICAHMDSNEPESLRLETRTSILISLNTRTMYVTDGPPCTNDYERFAMTAAGAEQQASKAQVVSLT